MNIGKNNLEVLSTLLDKLQLCQQTWRLRYIGENQLIDATQRVYCGVFKLEFALFIPTTTIKEISSKLRLSIITYNNRNAAIIHYFQIVNLSHMTAAIHTTQSAILIITTRSIVIVVSHGEEIVLFVAKKVVFLISISIISNG